LTLRTAYSALIDTLLQRLEQVGQTVEVFGGSADQVNEFLERTSSAAYLESAWADG
jgi:UDP-N-acetyl-D-mannosaminuronic acid transferase (WecB/TagA/CpsF family)